MPVGGFFDKISYRHRAPHIKSVWESCVPAGVAWGAPRAEPVGQRWELRAEVRGMGASLPLSRPALSHHLHSSCQSKADAQSEPQFAEHAGVWDVVITAPARWDLSEQAKIAGESALRLHIQQQETELRRRGEGKERKGKEKKGKAKPLCTAGPPSSSCSLHSAFILVSILTIETKRKGFHAN